MNPQILRAVGNFYIRKNKKKKKAQLEPHLRGGISYFQYLIRIKLDCLRLSKRFMFFRNTDRFVKRTIVSSFLHLSIIHINCRYRSGLNFYSDLFKLKFRVSNLRIKLIDE